MLPISVAHQDSVDHVCVKECVPGLIRYQGSRDDIGGERKDDGCGSELVLKVESIARAELLARG